MDLNEIKHIDADVLRKFLNYSGYKLVWGVEPLVVNGNTALINEIEDSLLTEKVNDFNDYQLPPSIKQG